MAWQWILRNWVRRSLTDALQDRLSQTAKPQRDANESASARPADIDVAIVFAMKSELTGLLDRMQDVVKVNAASFSLWRGQRNARRLILVASGVGQAAAARASEAIISAHHPKWIISAGLAGALQAPLAQSAFVLADRIVDESGDTIVVDTSAVVGSTLHRKDVHVGGLLTANRIIRLPAEKAKLGKAHDSLAVDMETFAVATIARQSSTHFLSVRVISDAVDEELPAFVDAWTSNKTAAGRAGVVVGSLWRRPSSIKQMMALSEQGLVAADRLADLLDEIIPQLVPSTSSKA